jgi:lipoprotein-anchoring transpeptidase ErfK/SrfK
LAFGGQVANYLGTRDFKTKSGDAMKALMLSKLAMVIVAAMVLAVQAMAQAAPKQDSQQEVLVAGVAKRIIVVSLEDRKLALVEDGQVKKVYSIAVGKPSTPSPVGTFTIARRAANPTYHHNGKTVLPGPGNPVGTRWMGLSIPGYGIHGTNEPNSIGKAASHGCIRMARADLEEFYGLVAVGDTVELVGERNEETARLFGEAEKPAAPAQPVLVAMAAPSAVPVPVPAPAQMSAAKPADRVLMASR